MVILEQGRPLYFRPQRPLAAPTRETGLLTPPTVANLASLFLSKTNDLFTLYLVPFNDFHGVP